MGNASDAKPEVPKSRFRRIVRRTLTVLLLTPFVVLIAFALRDADRVPWTETVFRVTSVTAVGVLCTVLDWRRARG